MLLLAVLLTSLKCHLSQARNLIMHLVPRTFLGKEQVLKTYLWKMMVASMILVVVVRMMLVGMW